MKHSIKLNLDNHVLSDGSYSVRMRISWNSQRLTVYLDNPVKIEQWDAEKKYPKKSAHSLTREVEKKTAEIGMVFDKARIEQTVPTADDIRKAIGKQKRKDEPTAKGHNLQAALNEFRNEQRNGWSLGTYTRFGVIANHLKEWRQDITVEEVDRTALADYVEYLYSRGLVNSTIAKNVSWVRWFLRWCYEKGYNPPADFDKYRPKFKGSDVQREVIYLTEDELRSIMELDLTEHPNLDRVRDTFLFCCFSGLRHSDALALKHSDIHGDHFRVVTKKTDDPLDVELNNITSAIIAKYDDGNPLTPALPGYCNQKMNTYLKQLAKMAKIDEPIKKVTYIRSERIEKIAPKYTLISTHCGRRTFIVTALYLDIHNEVIKKWTGHKGEKAMKPYIAIVDKQKKRNMAKFDTVLPDIPTEILPKK